MKVQLIEGAAPGKKIALLEMNRLPEKGDIIPVEGVGNFKVIGFKVFNRFEANAPDEICIVEFI